MKAPNATLSHDESLNKLLAKRNGGSINIRGIQYQVLYACLLILENLHDPLAGTEITLEGLEDIDFHPLPVKLAGKTFIQLKSSDNQQDAGSFWNLNVLQNFLEVHLIDKISDFRLIYNFKPANGALKQLFENKLDDKALEHWQSKFLSSYPDADFDLSVFLSSISYQRLSFDKLREDIKTSLFRYWNINSGTEVQFINALISNTLEWSKARKTVNHNHIGAVFSQIRDSYSKAVTNEAVTHNWIDPVDFSEQAPADFLTYYDGKAAKPYHIASQLPVSRKAWEKKVVESIAANDVTLIRSSSGQGKSTLAWQAAFRLKEQYKIYQLNIANSWDHANAIVEFLQSRVAIGFLPLIVIDGLDNEVDKWQMLVERTSLLPVRYLITSRHEDWARYGGDISRISIQPVDISLDLTEGEEIFRQLKQKGKLHSEITEWQPVWEQVFDKGLLIEYTYLLTRGEMIRERLQAQIRKIKDDRSPAAKTEILRLVAIADCLNLKIDTGKLVQFIHQTISFDSQDRGEVLNELHNEYFLNFDRKYIEGLHPIRSQHLLELLHAIVPVADTLIALYSLLEPNVKESYFANAPLLLNGAASDFYTGISQKLAQGPYRDMVAALNGISHAEPQKYWLLNKGIFDEAFTTGALELFTIHTIPGKKLDTFDNLLGFMPENAKGNIEKLIGLLQKLTTYDHNDSDVIVMAKSLSQELAANRIPKSSYEGLGQLSKWYKKLNLRLDFIEPLDEKRLSEALRLLTLHEAKSLLQYFNLQHPARYKTFIDENKEDIINYLRKATQSIVITENGTTLLIQYIYDPEDGMPSNEESVGRISDIYPILPFYNKYATEAIMLAFPSEDVIKVSQNDGSKNISPEYIPDSSEASYSRIWIDTINKNYQENSAFQWQKNIIALRELALQWSKSYVRVIEAILEGNAVKRDKEGAVLIPLRTKLSDSLTARKPYPTYAHTMPPQEIIKKYMPAIESWSTGLTNANNQLYNIFTPQGDNDRNVASINLKSIYFKLVDMQSAFHSMEELTVPHFDSYTLDKEENATYDRLYKTVHYYINHLPINEQVPVRVGRIAIEEWFNQSEKHNIQFLNRILRQAEQQTGYYLRLGQRTIDTETLSTVVIGAEDFNFAKDGAIAALALALADLAEFPATFFSVIAIKDGNAAGGLRFRREFFKSLMDSDDSSSEGPEDYLPIPIIPEVIHAELLGIQLRDLSNSSATIKFRIMTDLWKLSLFRQKLNKNNQFDSQWLQETEVKYLSNIRKGIVEIRGSDTREFEAWVQQNCLEGQMPTDQQILAEMFKQLQVAAENI